MIAAPILISELHDRGTDRRDMGAPRHMKEMSTAEAMKWLGSVQIGRIFFTSRAMPAVRPVNHVIDAGEIIIRSHEGSAIVTAANASRGAVVAYEADQLDPVTRTGWSVVVTGLAHLVEDSQEVRRYRDMLQPWVTGKLDHVICITPGIVTGFALVADPS